MMKEWMTPWPDPVNPFFEPYYWETEEFRALEKLNGEARALWKEYSTGVVPHQTRLFEAVAKAGELQPLLDEARDFNFVEEVTAPFPPAGLGSTTTLDRLIAAVYALAHEPEGRLPTVTRGIRAYIGEVRGKVQRFVATVPERPIDPNLEMEWKMIHSTVKDLKTCMGDMEMMARQLEQYQAFFKNLVYQ